MKEKDLNECVIMGFRPRRKLPKKGDPYELFMQSWRRTKEYGGDKFFLDWEPMGMIVMENMAEDD